MISVELVSGLIIPGMVINMNKSKRCTITSKAMDCKLRCWDALLVHVDDARVLVDNNAVEKVIRPIALGRKTGYSKGRNFNAATVSWATVTGNVGAEDCGKLAVKAFLFHADTSMARRFGKIQDEKARPK